MRNVGTVGEADADGFNRLEHHADVPTPGPTVAFNICMSRVRSERKPESEAKLGLGVLKRNAAADAQHVVDLPSQVRVDVEGEDHGFRAAFLAFPALAVFRAHAVGNGEAEARPEAVADLVRDEAGGNHLTLETTVFCLSGIVFVVKVHRNPGARGLHARAREKRHAGGVVMHGGKVVAHDAGAGHGAAHLDGGLLGELEARGVGLGGKGAGNHHRSGGNLESRVLQRKTPVN